MPMARRRCTKISPYEVSRSRMRYRGAWSHGKASVIWREILSLSQTSSGWQLIENQAILLWDEGSLQTYWLDGRRSAPVAGSA